MVKKSRIAEKNRLYTMIISILFRTFASKRKVEMCSVHLQYKKTHSL